LPRGLGEYARSPGQTWSKVGEWLNGRVQLRACTRVGKWTRVIGRITVVNHGTMLVGNRVRIYAHHARSIFTTFAGGRLTIGDGTVINYGVDIAATGLIAIGANCMIGTHVSILDNDFHELANRDQMPQPRPVIIEDGAWIGNRAIIMPGVTIGEGAAVGAGSVVIADVPPHTLAMGNPARIVREL
jgi:acetyltransferase-like isoleucine patch superfamily enzyme